MSSKIEKYICNYELSYFPSVTSSYGEDVLTVLARNKKKCLPKLLFISLLICRRLRSLPVARDVSRNSSALVGEERRGTAVFAGYFGSITNHFSGNAPALLSRTGCCNLHNIFKQFLNRFLVALFSPSARGKRQIELKTPKNERFESWPQ